MTMAQRRRQAGLTLIELLTAMAVFSVIATLAAQAYIATRRAAAGQMARAELVVRQVAALRRLERDALSARAVLYRLGPYQRDAHTLILAEPGEGAGGRRVVYRLEGTGPYALVRETFASSQTFVPTSSEVVAEGLVDGEFTVEGRLVQVRATVVCEERGRRLEMPLAATFCLRNAGGL
jgi:prepilin-type N-terminal cleavage/methylation domain-containing protein